jgi:hypothetical protein
MRLFKKTDGEDVASSKTMTPKLAKLREGTDGPCIKRAPSFACSVQPSFDW